MESSSPHIADKPGRTRIQAHDLQLLQAWAAAADGRCSVRARIILLSAEGRSAGQVSAEVGLGVPTVYKWCKRFRRAGAKGLQDLPRSGQPRRLSEDRRAEVVRITREEQPLRGSRWTIRTLARALGITQHQVRQIWAEAGLRPHAAPKQPRLRHMRERPPAERPPSALAPMS